MPAIDRSLQRDGATRMIGKTEETMRRILMAALAALASVSIGAGVAQAQTKPSVTRLANGEPKTAIYIGNSFFYYNNGLPGHVGFMQKAANPAEKNAYRTTMVTISGSGADWHDVASYFRPNAIGKYSFDENNNVVFNKLDRLFEVAVMMDCSQCPIHPQLKDVFVEYMKKGADTARANRAEPILFMSWAYKDKPEMTAALAEQYTLAGNANNALVIPAGLAFAKSIAKKPDLELYQPDKRHPSMAGTYLAAATVYAALARKSPVGNAYTAGLDPALAQYLQTIAWETVKEYYGDLGS